MIVVVVIVSYEKKKEKKREKKYIEKHGVGYNAFICIIFYHVFSFSLLLYTRCVVQ